MNLKTERARVAALARGSARYASEVPCMNCAAVVRFSTSCACVSCTLIKAANLRALGIAPKLRFKPDSARGVAFADMRLTYVGPMCDKCKGGERYTSSGACAECTRARRPKGYAPKLSDGACACCGTDPVRLVIDTEITPAGTGVRGWLCHDCHGVVKRLDLGRARQVVDYLERYA